jgi:hypothetical protein
MKGGDKAKVARRDFLRALGAGAGVAATGGVATSAHAQPAATDDKRKSLYRETEHIKTFYRVNRYPAKR